MKTYKTSYSYIAALLVTLLATINFAHANKKNTFNPSIFAQQYFDAWVQSQQPDATERDIDQYINFLTADAVWQHLPYAVSDQRKKDGSQKIKQGMMRWLNSHQRYKAKLLRIQANEHFVLIEFTSSGIIKDEENNTLLLTKHYIDVLELEDKKVAVIRRYDVR